MQGLKFAINITKRAHAENYIEFFKSKGVNNVISVLCNGTASESTLSLMGLENNERTMLLTMIRESSLESVIYGLKNEMDISAVGNGFFAVMPIDCIGGSSSLKYFAGEESIEKKESKLMNTENKTVMIVAIVDKGNTDLVMDSARGAGASGGTVVKGKGTGAEMAKFFGMSISEEKELVYILALKEKRDEIMKAIMEKAGSGTDAHGVLFALPVEKVVGINAFED